MEEIDPKVKRAQERVEKMLERAMNHLRVTNGMPFHQRYSLTSSSKRAGIPLSTARAALREVGRDAGMTPLPPEGEIWERLWLRNIDAQAATDPAYRMAATMAGVYQPTQLIGEDSYGLSAAKELQVKAWAGRYV